MGIQSMGSNGKFTDMQARVRFCPGKGYLNQALQLSQEGQKQDDKQPERTGDGKFSNYFIDQCQISTFIPISDEPLCVTGCFRIFLSDVNYYRHLIDKL